MTASKHHFLWSIWRVKICWGWLVKKQKNDKGITKNEKRQNNNKWKMDKNEKIKIEKLKSRNEKQEKNKMKNEK